MDSTNQPTAGLGKGTEVIGAESLIKLKLGIWGRPTRMPSLPKGHKVICGCDQGLGKHMYVCETLEDMQQLYGEYESGNAISIYWYSSGDPAFIKLVESGLFIPNEAGAYLDSRRVPERPESETLVNRAMAVVDSASVPEGNSIFPPIILSKVSQVQVTGEIWVDIIVDGKIIGELFYENGKWKIDDKNMQRGENAEWALETYGRKIFEEAQRQATEKFPDGKPTWTG